MGSSQRIQAVVKPRKPKAVLCDVNQPAVVYAESKAPVFLPDDHHWLRPRTV